MIRLAMLVTHLRAEEKLLLAAFDKRGIQPDVLLDRDLNVDLLAGPEQPAPSGRPWAAYDVILERCVSTSRGLYMLAALEAWGVPTVNRHTTAVTCSDKFLTTLALARAGVPQPEARAAFAPDSALAAVAAVGYPAVLKPVVGSWGRLLARVENPSAAEAIIEHRETLGGYPHHVHYAQAYVDKPGRDIRAFVVGNEVICAILRESEHWITNTARGGRASNCPLTPALTTICRDAAAAVGGGLLAIDVLEAPDGRLLVNEINHTMEFRNSSAPTGVDIAAAIADYVLQDVRVPA